MNQTEVNLLMSKYYTNYYKTQLGLPDWKSRVELRLNEEKNYCERFITFIEAWFNYDFKGKKVLVAGSGTGGELVNFHKKGAIVHGVEPNEDAIQICLMKAELCNIPKKNITREFLESLPFKDDMFDFIYCFTVLEHVNDVKKSINEMTRCLKTGGSMLIVTPDYRQLYEGHYKIPLPMILPTWFNKIILRVLGRPTGFLSSINKVNSRQLQTIFSELPVVAIRVYKRNYEKISHRFFSYAFVVSYIQNKLITKLGVDINQIWVLHKDNRGSKDIC